MSIRWKLNLAVAALAIVFLIAALFAIYAVAENAEHTRLFSRSRQLAQFTADARTDIYIQLAQAYGAPKGRRDPEAVGWPRYLLDDIDIQIRLADDKSRRHWLEVRAAVERLGDLGAESASPGKDAEPLQSAERHLRDLRHMYSLAEHDAIAQSAATSLLAQIAIGIACLVTFLLFIVYLLLVRDWLVKPVEILKTAADRIGEGTLDYQVPLQGHDELAQLARRLDAMALNLKRHQRELIEARELSAIGELCAHVAHGLRNPLASIRVSAQLALRRTQHDKHELIAVKEILAQADRMDERITSLFDFSKPLELHRQCTTFAELACAAEAEVRDTLLNRCVRLVTEDLTGESVWCLDRERMAEAIAELVSNAAHHSPPNSNIDLRGSIAEGLRRPSSALNIEIIDRGAGIPTSTMNKVFDLFFSSRPNGTGMGLALASRTIQRHGGTIALASELHRGTTATVSVNGRCPYLSGLATHDGEVCPQSRCVGCSGRLPPWNIMDDSLPRSG